jgi:hypothetical protein
LSIKQPETSKVNHEAQKKAYNTIHNISSVIHKFHSKNRWTKMATLVEKLYTNLKEPLIISPLFL